MMLKATALSRPAIAAACKRSKSIGEPETSALPSASGRGSRGQSMHFYLSRHAGQSSMEAASPTRN